MCPYKARAAVTVSVCVLGRAYCMDGVWMGGWDILLATRMEFALRLSFVLQTVFGFSRLGRYSLSITHVQAKGLAKARLRAARHAALPLTQRRGGVCGRPDACQNDWRGCLGKVGATPVAKSPIVGFVVHYGYLDYALGTCFLFPRSPPFSPLAPSPSSFAFPMPPPLNVFTQRAPFNTHTCSPTPAHHSYSVDAAAPDVMAAINYFVNDCISNAEVAGGSFRVSPLASARQRWRGLPRVAQEEGVCEDKHVREVWRERTMHAHGVCWQRVV
eukprot:359892-Chlamydomonas_euryale.AAC.2